MSGIYDYTFEVFGPMSKTIYGKRDTEVVVIASGWINSKGDYEMVYINQNWGRNRDISLAYIPKKERTYDNCVNAVKNGLGLTYVPEHLRDKEVCLMALARNKTDFSFVPEQFHNDPDFAKFK